MEHHLPLAFKKAIVRTEPILLERALGKVAPSADLNDLMDWQNARGCRPVGDDHTNHGSHLGRARRLVWTTVVEMGLAIVLLLCWLILHFICQIKVSY
jgi:hypothetical protein